MSYTKFKKRGAPKTTLLFFKRKGDYVKKFEAIFNEITETVTLSGLYQYDHNIKLYIKMPNIPPSCEVHFTNHDSKEAIVLLATEQQGFNVVEIPNGLLEENRDITAYIYFSNDTIGKTVKKVILKVEERIKPQDFISANPDATTILGDVVNKINQNIADNQHFKNEIDAFLKDHNKLSVSSHLTEAEIDAIIDGTYVEVGGDEPNQSVKGGSL